MKTPEQETVGPADPSASMADAPAAKELRIEARVDRLDEVLNFINSELERRACPPEPQDEINCAAEEIFVNIAKYAYTPAAGTALVSIDAGDDFVIRFEDSGRPFNPLESPAPDLDKPLMERKIGGLGIYLVKKLMDTVNYTRVDGKNVLVMSKKIK
jgi:anti-sigma regulatory factor (Ser/Thr protein kinase)